MQLRIKTLFFALVLAAPLAAQVSNPTTSAAPSGAAAGDLSGTYPNPGVAKINGATVPTIAATTGVLYDTAGTLSVAAALPNAAFPATVTASSFTLDNSGSGNATITSKGASLANYNLNAGATTYGQIGIDSSHNLFIKNPNSGNINVQFDVSTGAATFVNLVNATKYQVNSIDSNYAVTSDFTTAANTSLQTITGLTWTLIASKAQIVPFHCALVYSQATAVVAVAFGIQAATIAPNYITASGEQFTSATANTQGSVVGLATTTATNIVSATPGAIGTNYNVTLDGTIDNPSNASSNVINIMVSTATSGDAVTVKRGSYCRIN